MEMVGIPHYFRLVMKPVGNTMRHVQISMVRLWKWPKCCCGLLCASRLPCFWQLAQRVARTPTQNYVECSPHACSTNNLPYPWYHSLSRTYLVTTKFLRVPLFRPNGCHREIGCHEHRGTNKGPIHSSTSWRRQYRQQHIYCNLAGIVRTKQIREERMRR